MNQRILAFSSSREGSSGYLETAAPVIKEFVGDKPLTIAFVPFASVDTNYEAYTDKVREALPAAYTIVTVTNQNAAISIKNADVIMVGGGNTFKLLHDLYKTSVIELIKQKVDDGTPYIGWSAGANITGATICTTNDMPIINPGSFEALGFFPFQINPHYYNVQVPGFNGETRDQRLEEFLQLNPSVPVVALPEGTALLFDENKLQLIGNKEAVLLTCKNNELHKASIKVHDDLNYLM